MIHLDSPCLICVVCRKSFAAVIPEIDEKCPMTDLPTTFSDT
jgi:hypothetical protein